MTGKRNTQADSTPEEKKLLEAVTGILKSDFPDLAWFHSYDARRDRQPGLPDLVVTGVGGMLWRELKGEHGAFSPSQHRWKYAIIASGGDWSVWRPADLESGRIRCELESLTVEPAGIGTDRAFAWAMAKVCEVPEADGGEAA